MKTVWVGVPITGNIQGPYGLPAGCIVNYSVNPQGYPTYYQWTMQGKILCPPNMQWQYLYGENTSTATVFAGCQSRYIGVTVGNICGLAPYEGRFVDIGNNYECTGGMKMITDTTIIKSDIYTIGELDISPNPASDNIKVTIKTESINSDNSVLSNVIESESSKEYMVSITDLYGNRVYASKTAATVFTLPISGINNGTYIVTVTNTISIWQGTLIVYH